MDRCVDGVAPLYCVTSWLPSMLRNAGSTLSQALSRSIVLNLGGILGALIFSAAMSKLGVYKTLAAGFILSAVFLLLAVAVKAIVLALGLIFLAGFFGPGAVFCVPVAVLHYYPAELHSTGIGYATAVSRIGAVVGARGGGMIMWLHNVPYAPFYLCASIATTAGVCFAGMGNSR